MRYGPTGKTESIPFYYDKIYDHIVLYVCCTYTAIELVAVKKRGSANYCTMGSKTTDVVVHHH